MDEIHEVTGMKLAKLRDVTTERKQWRRLAMMVARIPGTDSTRCQFRHIQSIQTGPFRRTSGGEGVSPTQGRGHKTSLYKT